MPFHTYADTRFQGGLLTFFFFTNLEFQLSSEFSKAEQEDSNTIRVNWMNCCRMRFDQPNVATNPFIRR